MDDLAYYYILSASIGAYSILWMLLLYVYVKIILDEINKIKKTLEKSPWEMPISYSPLTQYANSQPLLHSQA